MTQNCYIPWSWPWNPHWNPAPIQVQPYITITTNTTKDEEMDQELCKPGQHHYVRVVEDSLVAAITVPHRLVLYCEKCGDCIEHTLGEEDEPVQDH